ncbi:MAG: right-handed parallel beta-helix repeat-containing protein [Candidatus Thorarchaeota archaeon]|jgi:parallel beta-helix repeat protein
MKQVRKAILFVFLLVTPLLLAGVISPVQMENVTLRVLESPSKTMTLSYVDHGVINLVGDDAFHTLAGTELWDGDGSETTPYIIEGYNFSIDGTCITLTNVSVYFEIRDCYFSYNTSAYSGNGLSFTNVTHASIVDSIFEGVFFGIWLSWSHNAIIDNCTIRDSPSSGIFLTNTNNGYVNECDISTNSHAIRLNNANNAVITNNVLHDSIGGSGINLYESHFALITGNEVYSCSDSGIKVIVSNNCTIENNVIYENWFFTVPECGIYLDFGHNATIVENEIYNNAQNGIFLTSSDWVYIFGNDIYNNADHGIDAVSSDNGTITQNNIHGNGWWPVLPNALCGVYLGSQTHDWIISENMIWNNTPSGISLESTVRVDISGNEIFNNTRYGVYGAFSNDISVVENQIYGNGWNPIPYTFNIAGIHNYAGDWWIEGNSIWNNTEYGVWSEGDDTTVIGNTIWSNNNSGIGVSECYDNIIHENTVFDNERGIELMTIGTNLTRNIVYDNEVGVFASYIGYCYMYENDIGWNTVNAIELSAEAETYWHNNDSTGNWWGDYNGVGVYDITNGTGVENQDLFPSKSLDLVKPASIEFEILETGNVIVWEASALNPSHYGVLVDGGIELVFSWDGGNIEYLADGLSHGLHTIVVEVYHISGHYLGNSSTAAVEDVTPPTAIVGPSQVTITFGDSVSAQYSSSDPSGVQWTVNNTVFFAISSSGMLTSIADLTVGAYIIQITALDPHGHSAVLDVTVVVNAPTDTGLPTTLIMMIGAGGALVVVIVVIVVLKKKGT